MSKKNTVATSQSTHVDGSSFPTELRQQIVTMSHWSERALEALCFGIPPASYNDLSVPDQDREQMRREIARGIESGELQAEPTGGGNAPYDGRWRIERVNAIRWAIGRCPKLPEWLARHARPEIFARQEAEKKAAGRYTLREAAEEITRNTGERFKPLLEKLKAAVSAGTLVVYEPGRYARHMPKTVRDSYEEACAADLNAWLVGNEPGITWRFVEPETEFYAAFVETVYNGHAIEWRYWVHQMPTLTAGQAARLMCALDPHEFKTLDERPNKNNPTAACEKVRKIQCLAEAKQTPSMTPPEWLEWARKHGFKMHTGFVRAVEELARQDASAGEGPRTTGPDGGDSEQDTTQAATTSNDHITGTGTADEDLAVLFDPVSVAALAKMFPTRKDEQAALDDWKKFANRAARNGLADARAGRRQFNPYKAGLWWLRTQTPTGWDAARLNRVLAKNLPARHRDSSHLLTDDAID